MTEARSGNSGLGFGLAFQLQDQFTQPANQIMGSFNRLSDGADRLSNNIQNSLSRVYAGAAQIEGARILIEPFFKAIKTYGQYESLEKGLTTIMGSINAAKTELISLREVAKLPGLGFKEAVSGSIQLQSVQMSANMARNALLGFGNAVALIGGGRVELDGVILQLRKMMSIGKVLGADLRPILSRIPQLALIMKKIWGTSSPEELNKLGISAKIFVEKVTNELLKLPKAGAGISNSLENLGDTLFLTLKSVGQPLAPFVDSIVEKLSLLGEKIEKFADTSLGKFTIKLVTAVVAISSIRLALAAFQSWLPEVIKKTGLFAPVVSTITSTVTGLFKAMTGGFMSVGKSLFTFVSANFATIALVGLGVALQQLMKGYDSFVGLMERKQGVLTGFSGFLQKVGGYAKAVYEIFNSVSEKGFSLNEDTFSALQKLGISQSVLNIGTWIVRLQQVWFGFRDTMIAAFGVMKNVFSWVGEKLDKLGISINSNLDGLEKWKSYGRILGGIVIAALAGITLGFIAAGVSAVAAGISAVIAWLPIIGTALLIGLAVAAIGVAFYGIYLAAKWVVEKVIEYFKFWFLFYKEMGKGAYNAGVKFVTSLWDGIKAMWDKFTNWLNNAWSKVTDSIKDSLGLKTDININSTNSTIPSDESSYTPFQSEKLSSMMERRLFIQQAPLQMQAAMGSPSPVVVDKSTVKNLTLVTQIDGRDVKKSLYNLDEIDSGR